MPLCCEDSRIAWLQPTPLSHDAAPSFDYWRSGQSSRRRALCLHDPQRPISRPSDRCLLRDGPGCRCSCCTGSVRRGLSPRDRRQNASTYDREPERLPRARIARRSSSIEVRERRMRAALPPRHSGRTTESTWQSRFGKALRRHLFPCSHTPAWLRGSLTPPARAL